MTILRVVQTPDPVLREMAEPVECVDDEIRKQMDDMVHTMYAHRGCGLAANQVGKLNRVIVVDTNPVTAIAGMLGMVFGLRSTAYRMANPEIIWRSDSVRRGGEGCLSMRGEFGRVARPGRIKVKYLDYNGEEREMTARGLKARCLQHEIDHLNGVLFTDRIQNPDIEVPVFRR